VTNVQQAYGNKMGASRKNTLALCDTSHMPRRAMAHKLFLWPHRKTTVAALFLKMRSGGDSTLSPRKILPRPARQESG